ncbi:MAG TPA: hypothetical protein VE258_01325 [Ktedonobacterales bacterium]|nr:hypothetical protein [Ktedonobacterales bacterium]
MLDVAGHYGRPDVFELTVRTAAHPKLAVQGSAPVAHPADAMVLPG